MSLFLVFFQLHLILSTFPNWLSPELALSLGGLHSSGYPAWWLKMLSRFRALCHTPAGMSRDVFPLDLALSTAYTFTIFWQTQAYNTHTQYIERKLEHIETDSFFV